MNKWKIGLSSWIIQDGNYGDFYRDQKVNFAIELFLFEFQTSQTKQKQAQNLGASKYRVNAEVVFVADRCFVLDFGILAYQEAVPPQSIRMGDWLQAEVYLGVDPFFYFAELAQIEGMPPMIYTWHINKIGIETAPFIETVNVHGSTFRTRDVSKSSLKEIQKTDAWNDDNGYGEYLFECSCLDVPPR